MVHFIYKWLDYYICEFYRLLQNGGFVFVHHSNLSSSEVHIEKDKDEYWWANPGGRALVSKEDVAYIAEKHGFRVVEQQVIDWIIHDLDCITLLSK